MKPRAMRTRTLLAAAIPAFGCGATWAQASPTQATSGPTTRRGQILEMARAADAQLAVARAAAGREKPPQAKTANLPNVNATINARRNRDSSSAYSGTRTFNAYSSAITVNQALYRPANWAGIKQAELMAAAGALEEADLLVLDSALGD